MNGNSDQAATRLPSSGVRNYQRRLEKLIYPNAAEIEWRHVSRNKPKRKLFTGRFIAVIFQRARLFGLGRLRVAVSGGASLEPDVARMLIGLGSACGPGLWPHRSGTCGCGEYA